MVNCEAKLIGSEDWHAAEFLGLLQDEHGDYQAVLRFDGSGMCLTAIHPSRVRLIRKES